MPSIRLSRRRPARALTGLDIEPGGIRAVCAAPRDGRLVVERVAEIPLEPGIIRDGEVADAEGLAEALRALFAEHPLDKRVRVGLANQRVVVRTLQLPPIPDARELEAAVRFQAADEVPMPLDQAVLDHASLGIVETPDGPRQRVLIVAARRDIVERLLGALRAAGLRPEGVDLAAFAMVRAHATSDTSPVLHLSVGGTVNLAVARGTDCLFTRVIAGGLEPIAIDLAERRSVPVEAARAELAACDLELAPDDAAAADADDLPSGAKAALEDGVRRIAAEVRTTMDFHHGTFAGDTAEAVERVLLTGPATAIRGFAGALEQRLGMRVETPALEAPEGIDAGRFGVAAGLAVEEAAA